ncbi:MAG: hypothetical protein IJX95_02480 [Lachnospiraceae bacterium]|nr:hypothetical protein [Lachnospiraceae bacterium]
MLKDKLEPVLSQMFEGNARKMLPVFITGAMGLLASMTPISAPSVSLEGKHIWILRSMPISGADVLRAKLRFHCIASVPVACVGALVLGIVYRIGWFETIFAVIGTALLFVLTGILGLVFNMCFPRLDWPNEAGPCKQSMAVFFSIFGMMFVSVVYVGLYFGFTALLGGAKNSLLAFSIVNVLFIFINYLFYLLMVKWGGKKFETL